MKVLKKNQANLLLAMAFIMPLTFSVWQVLLNNYVVELANFTGKEIGLLQSIREIPGFLAFSAIFLLPFFREQRMALFFLALMCVGIAFTGFFKIPMSIYLITFIMSIGFHFFETMNQSLILQWTDEKNTAQFLGQAMSIKGLGALISYAFIGVLLKVFHLDYSTIYLIAGGVGLILVIYLFFSFPIFEQKEEQKKKIILKKKYLPYYILVFFSGARRQIFMVFAGFMMVSTFKFSAFNITALYLINHFFNMIFAPKIGEWIGRIGEKKALCIEYTGLIFIFIGYGLVQSKWIAAGLYILDHLFFAMAIALKTYFKKIADPEDIAGTVGISFTINHIAAVVIPVLLGAVWLKSHAMVFLIGVGFAAASLIYSQMVIPKNES